MLGWTKNHTLDVKKCNTIPVVGSTVDSPKKKKHEDQDQILLHFTDKVKLLYMHVEHW